MKRILTEGRILLIVWLEGCTQEELAQRLRISQGAVGQWVAGLTRPNPILRAALQQVTGIPVEAWLTKADQRKIQRMGESGR